MANPERRIISFIGPEGAGKTTVAKRLAAETATPIIITGDIFREIAANDNSEYGDIVRNSWAKNEYVDPQILLSILAQGLKRKDLANGFILDGGFRTIDETKGFRSMLEEAHRVLPVVVVYLRIPGWIAMERLVTGENARKRKDDTEEGVLARLSNYYSGVGQRVTLIKKENYEFFRINAMQDRESVFEDVRQVLT